EARAEPALQIPVEPRTAEAVLHARPPGVRQPLDRALDHPARAGKTSDHRLLAYDNGDALRVEAGWAPPADRRPRHGAMESLPGAAVRPPGGSRLPGGARSAVRHEVALAASQADRIPPRPLAGRLVSLRAWP